MSAVSQEDSTVFILKEQEIKMMENEFQDVYKELQ